MTAHEKRNIVIIGGGIIGCTSAYYLTRHPSYDPSKHSITLLEAGKIAGGASGKAGGLLALWAYPSSLVPLSYGLHKRLSEEHGGEERWGYRAVHCAQVESVGRHLRGPAVEGKTGEAVEGRNAPTGKGDSGREGVSLLKRDAKALGKLRAAGVPGDLDWVDAEGLRAYDEMGDPSTTAQVHPFQFTTAMAELAVEKGVRIKVGAAVKKINYCSSGDAVESVTYEDKTNGGKTETIPATDVVVAAGPWTANVYPTAPISALRAHSVTIRPSRPVSAYALFTQIKLPAGFGKTNESNRGKGNKKSFKAGWGEQIVTPEIYARPQNEVYACGEGDHMVALPKSTDDVQVDESRCQDIVDYCAAISDELRDGEVTARQACYLPNVNAGSGHPLVGLTGVRGEVMAAGHTCWGIQNGPGTGKLIPIAVGTYVGFSGDWVTRPSTLDRTVLTAAPSAGSPEPSLQHCWRAPMQRSLRTCRAGQTSTTVDCSAMKLRHAYTECGVHSNGRDGIDHAFEGLLFVKTELRDEKGWPGTNALILRAPLSKKGTYATLLMMRGACIGSVLRLHPEGS
ncbi:hypothetical protein LTR12_012254 [Friedmanniomyces endolithicus]|nr:hypothetical protein LTR12_012254 [Friedmanniomyces endolithicus]